jgi:replicative DNA helicase
MFTVDKDGIRQRPQIRIVSDIPDSPDPYSSGAEAAVIVSCLVQPDALTEVAGKLVADDFDGSLHRRIADILLGLHLEGRKPSVEAICAVVGDAEVAPNVSVRDYLRGLIEDNLYRLGMLSLNDAMETVLDASQRRKLAQIGSELNMVTVTATASVSNIASLAMLKLDEVMASLRTGKRRAYAASEAAETTLAAIEHGMDVDYPTTGLADLDRILGGWPRGQLSIVAGRPGMGKSLFAVSSVLKAARAGFNVMFFSLEMLEEQLGARMLADLAYTNQNPIYYEDIAMRRLRQERDLDRLKAASGVLRGLPLHVEEQRGLTVAEIIARAKKHANKLAKENKKLDLLVVDHIGLVRASDRYKGQRHRELAEITDGLATCAKELEISAVGLCQLNRGVEGRENKRPDLGDLRESGAIEEDASAIIFLFRAAYYLEKQRHDEHEAEQARKDMLERVRNKIELSLAKNRNGRVGIVDAFVDVGANALRNGSFAK